jgi:hypothetical protein
MTDQEEVNLEKKAFHEFRKFVDANPDISG